jgi:hypothetical protein
VDVAYKQFRQLLCMSSVHIIGTACEVSLWCGLGQCAREERLLR